MQTALDQKLAADTLTSSTMLNLHIASNETAFEKLQSDQASLQVALSNVEDLSRGLLSRLEEQKSEIAALVATVESLQAREPLTADEIVQRTEDKLIHKFDCQKMEMQKNITDLKGSIDAGEKLITQLNRIAIEDLKAELEKNISGLKL